MIRLLAIALALGATGCVREEVTAAILVQAGRADLMRATRDWQGERVIVKGRVQSKALVDRESERLSGTVFGPTVTARRVVSQYQEPLVVLTPGAYCFLGRGDLDEVIELQEGQEVALVCEVRKFRQTQVGIVPILRCSF